MLGGPANVTVWLASSAAEGATLVSETTRSLADYDVGAERRELSLTGCDQSVAVSAPHANE